MMLFVPLGVSVAFLAWCLIAKLLDRGQQRLDLIRVKSELGEAVIRTERRQQFDTGPMRALTLSELSVQGDAGLRQVREWWPELERQQRGYQ